MSDAIQVVTTTEKQDDALAIARMLVERRLAACVQVLGPVTSVYRWKDQIETSQEWQCWAKSRLDCYPRLEQAIRQNHPYEEPEILAMPIAAGSSSYLAWLTGELAP